MVKNQAPTDEEVDEFMELYDELGTIKGVAEKVNWSRPTVSKWVNRRLEEEEGDEEGEEDDGGVDTGRHEPDEPAAPAAGTGQTAAPSDGEEDFSDILVEAPPTPNDIMLDVLDADPNISDKHLKYVKSKVGQYGQLSPSDLSDTLSDIKISNKRQTISRVTKNYQQRINAMIRNDPEITDYEEWATLMTKVTGDPSYIQRARGDDDDASGDGIYAPPAGNGRGPEPEGGTGFSPHRPPGRGVQNGHPQGGYGRYEGRGPAGGPPNTAPGYAPGQPQGIQVPQTGGDDGDDEVTKELVGLVKELQEEVAALKAGGGDTDPAPEPKSTTDQLDELIQLRNRINELQDDGGKGDEVAAQMSELVGQLSQRIDQLESQIANGGAGGGGQRGGPQAGEVSEIMEIAQLAETVDDPDTLRMLMEMKTDPDVLEARARREEIETDKEWKKTLAESLTPKAAEQAISALASLATGVSQGAQQQGQYEAQPAQPAQPAQQQSQVQPAREAPQTPQPAGAGRPPAERSAGSESPLREEGMREEEAVKVTPASDSDDGEGMEGDDGDDEEETDD